MLSIDKGRRFGKLIIIKEVEKYIQPSGQSQRAFLCQCDCGNKKIIRLSHLIHNRIKSCGCMVGEMHNDSYTKLYRIWRGMKNRVSEYHSQRYLYYDRGINICHEWDESYLAFKKWALKNGFKEGLTIDRINNAAGYYPKNCRFVTQQVNCNNRRNTLKYFYKGKIYAFHDLLRKTNTLSHRGAIEGRIKRGWKIEDAFDKPIRRGNYKGFIYTEKLKPPKS